MKHCLILLAFIPAIWLTACNSNSLKQHDAKKQIAGYYEAHPNELIKELSFDAVIKNNDSGINSKIVHLYLNEGLIKLKDVKVQEPSDSIYFFETTEKGKPYQIKDSVNKDGYPVLVVKLFDFHFDEITDIKEGDDKKEAGVFFDLAISNPTPFNRDESRLDHKRHLLAYFTSDGNNNWKLQSVHRDPRLNKLISE